MPLERSIPQVLLSRCEMVSALAFDPPAPRFLARGRSRWWRSDRVLSGFRLRSQLRLLFRVFLLALEFEERRYPLLCPPGDHPADHSYQEDQCAGTQCDVKEYEHEGSHVLERLVHRTPVKTGIGIPEELGPQAHEERAGQRSCDEDDPYAGCLPPAAAEKEK